MIPILEFDKLAPEDILNRDIQAEENVSVAVDAVLAEVKVGGDAALKAYTKRFDGVELEDLRVTEAEIESAWNTLDSEFIETLEMADILRRHLQRLDKFRIQGVPGGFDFRLRHPQVLQFHAVEPLGIGFQGGVAVGLDLRQHRVHGGADVFLGLDVPFQDVLRRQLFKFQNRDQRSVTSVSLPRRVSISRRLNW